MYRVNAQKVKREPYIETGSKKARIKRLIAGEDGARTTSLHEIIVHPGGYTAPHRHRWEHQLYVLAGRGAIRSGGEEEVPLRPGDAILVRGGETHQFVQKGREPLRFLCVTPL
jgi:quercetin dioxygenase-like cupin family protein